MDGEQLPPQKSSFYQYPSHPSLPSISQLAPPASPSFSNYSASQQQQAQQQSSQAYPHPTPFRSFSKADSYSSSVNSPALAPTSVSSPTMSAPHKEGHSPPAGPSAGTPTEKNGSGSNVKRKRKPEGSSAKADKKNKGSDDDEAGEKSKRTKTQRACDPCRRKKIRCDIIPDSEPPICQHCKTYNHECTFFLPITETRFKKKRMEEAAAAAAAANSTPPISEARTAQTPRPESAVPEPRDIRPLHHLDSRSDVKIYGPTSLSFMMHSTPSIPLRTFENHDQRYHQSWEVGRTGDGFIQVKDPSGATPSSLPKTIDYQLDRDTLASLINGYFKEVAPQFPVISESEFLTDTSPPPVLLYAICSMAATRRGSSYDVFNSLRMAVNQIMKSEDVMNVASVVNVQSLLLLSMNTDIHSSSVSSGMTAAWLRLGTAIRMAQELGMYRAEAVKMQVNLRRRIWGALVVADRWYGACFGHPFMIDVLDCDVRLPTPDDPNDPETRLTKPNCYMAELIKLSILLGRVTKTIYSPSGLMHATDAMIEILLADLDHWKANIHPDLIFKGRESILPAGLLHLFFTCVCMMFWRVFLRLSYTCPKHLKFSLTVERWTELVQMSRESIDWLDANENIFDTWFFVFYAASSCALIQYHTFARRKDPDAVAYLKKLSDCVKRWEAKMPSAMSMRRKNAEIINLLYEATQLPDDHFSHTGDKVRLNPTVGVSDRRNVGQESFRRLVFRKDPSRPGGGVFIADEKSILEAVSDVPKGTVIGKDEAVGYSSSATNSAAAGAPMLGMPTVSSIELPPGAGSTEDPVASLLVNIAPMQQVVPPMYGRYGELVPGQGNVVGSVGTFGLDESNGFGGSTRASNVNPTMNMDHSRDTSLAGGGEVHVLNLLDQSLDGSTAMFPMLDGLPIDTFQWDGWDQYFQKMALPSQQHHYASASAEVTNAAGGRR